jgi:allantoate deiminase
VLESLGLPLGVVDSIAGQTRGMAEFSGQANHAGTTPMALRHDALCAAAEWTLFVEQTAQQTPGLVATVGSFKVAPDAVNIVPGKAVLSLDVRHSQDDIRKTAFDDVIREGGEIAARRGVQFRWTLRVDQAAVPMDAKVTSLIEAAVLSTGAKVHRMTSGAGHDAMITAKHIPSGMIFLRSPGGISHHPDESVMAEDVELALKAGRAFVDNFK